MRHFCSADTEGITASRGIPKSVHSGLTSSDSRTGNLRRRVDVPAIAPLFVGVVRGQAGTSDRCRRDSSGSLPSAGTFHTSVTHRRGVARLSGCTVTNSRDRTAENHQRWTRLNRAVSRQRDELHLRSDRPSGEKSRLL